MLTALERHACLDVVAQNSLPVLGYWCFHRAGLTRAIASPVPRTSRTRQMWINIAWTGSCLIETPAAVSTLRGFWGSSQGKNRQYCTKEGGLGHCDADWDVAAL